jgi:hypothetical protein
MEAFEAHFYPADPKNARPIEKIWPTEEDIHLLASQLPHFLPPPPPVALDQSAPQPDALMALETTLEVYAGINEFIDELRAEAVLGYTARKRGPAAWWYALD